MVRAIASHHCVPGSIPELGVGWRGLSLLSVLALAPRRFPPGTPVFPSPQNLNLRATELVSRDRLLSVNLVKQT